MEKLSGKTALVTGSTDGVGRQYVIWLDAEYELTASDGEKRVIGVGEVVLAEDTTGKGHITKPLGEKLAHGLFIPID